MAPDAVEPLLHGPADALGPAASVRSLPTGAPAVDVQETEQEYLIKAELAGMKKEDVKVNVLNGVLTIEGERTQEKEEKGKKFHQVERLYGTFVRQFSLPAEVDAAKVQAEYKDGVLSVHLPKAAVTKPTAVTVKVA